MLYVGISCLPYATTYPVSTRQELDFARSELQSNQSTAKSGTVVMKSETQELKCQSRDTFPVTPHLESSWLRL